MLLSAYSALANKDKMKHVSKLIETVSVKNGQARRPCKNVRELAADKGYDADEMRNYLKKTETVNTQQCATISSRKNLLMAAKKVPAARRAMGTIARLF